ncbi:MAG: hypothetical protein IJJ10_06515 [Bacillus sp. (in: Bacteria)]|nr:hypothetical protein [Bacillus sp. (in: firmicutes)]
MAEKGLFYNAFPDDTFETGYDRNYSADDISNWFSIVCDTGVLKGGLQVTAGSGLALNVAVGKATIKGKGYINTSILPLTLAAAPTSGTRYDMVILRMDNTQIKSARRSYILVRSVTSVPTVSNLTRTDDIYELLLGYAVINANATSVNSVVDKRGDTTLCPYFTAVKGYDDYYDAIVQQFESNVTLNASSINVVTTIPSSLYNNKYSLVEVYTNGLREENTDYTVATNSSYITITFTTAKNANTQVNVILSNFIDGEGLATAINQYTQWVQDVATLKAANNYTYVCNGVDDNVQITNIARTFLTGGNDYGSMKLNIVGTFGYSAMAYGDGTSANPYRFFNFSGDFNRKLILDFTNCSEIVITPTAGKYTVIFPTQTLTVIGANIRAYQRASNSTIKVFSNSSGEIRCERCRFWIEGYLNSNIAACGTFVGCRGSVLNETGNSYCFQPADASLIRVDGGEYYAYTGNGKSAIVGQSNTNAVSILYAVNAPTQARSGYEQTYSVYQVGNAGWLNCTDLISALPLSVVSGKSNIRGTIALSKGGNM